MRKRANEGSQLPAEYFICVSFLVGWSINNCQGFLPCWSITLVLVHKHLILSSPSLNSRNQISLKHSGYPTISFPAYSLKEGLIAIHCSTWVVPVIPLCFHGDSYVVVFQLRNGFQLLLFVAYAACLGSDAFHWTINHAIFGVRFSYVTAFKHFSGF